MSNKKRILGNSTLATALIFCLWQPDALAVPLLTNANRSESLLAQIEADTEVFEDTPVTLV